MPSILLSLLCLLSRRVPHHPLPPTFPLFYRLKIYNPMKPEGSLVLSIGRTWEEKQVCKILCGLEVNEPGENWISKGVVDYIISVFYSEYLINFCMPTLFLFLLSSSSSSTLISLSGYNLLGYNFRWEQDGELFPGWVLTQPWLTAEGMVSRGIISVRYYSGDGKGYYGCQAHILYRRALTYMVREMHHLSLSIYHSISSIT